MNNKFGELDQLKAELMDKFDGLDELKAEFDELDQLNNKFGELVQLSWIS